MKISFPMATLAILVSLPSLASAQLPFQARRQTPSPWEVSPPNPWEVHPAGPWGPGVGAPAPLFPGHRNHLPGHPWGRDRDEEQEKRPPFSTYVPVHTPTLPMPIVRSRAPEITIPPQTIKVPVTEFKPAAYEVKVPSSSIGVEGSSLTRGPFASGKGWIVGIGGAIAAGLGALFRSKK